MILADLKFAGKPRRVILHAPKIGFFFVIERQTGRFISANNLVEVSWAKGYDTSGRLKPEDADKLRAFIQGTPDAIRPKAR